LKPHHVVLDPMCGAGTILAETFLFARQHERPQVPWNLTLLGGDIDPHHLRAAKVNLHALAELPLRTWDARKLPLDGAGVDRIISNLPFGKQLSSPEEIGPLYRAAAKEMDRVLRPKGKAVVLVAEAAALKDAVRPLDWKQERFVPVRVLGQRAVIMVYRKG
jgi:23S rRNA G2445 N2-methylase RlmL